MPDDYDIGYAKPPETSRWQKGQSGNPKGRPKTRADHLRDAAAILSEPVMARTSEGKPVSLAARAALTGHLCDRTPRTAATPGSRRRSFGPSPSCWRSSRLSMRRSTTSASGAKNSLPGLNVSVCRQSPCAIGRWMSFKVTKCPGSHKRTK